jgi:hypothetical protein
MSHNTHTHLRTARRGGNNPLQHARRMQGELIPWIGVSAIVLVSSLLWSVYADLGATERLTLRIVVGLSATCIAALLRRMARLAGRITTLRTEQRAAPQTAAPRRVR